VELVETVEKSGKIYMFAENYPYMAFNQEMRRLYQAGKVGTFMYGEGEYIHPTSADEKNQLAPGRNHWRNWIPGTYYCTHALAPLMFITDTMPVKVNGFVIPSENDPTLSMTARVNDPASMITVRMDNGAVAKLLQVGLRGHGNWVRIHGSKGLMENLRTGDRNMLRIVREQYGEKRIDPQEMIYLPDFPEHHEEAMNAGHAGGDFFMNYHFAQAIRTKKQPYLDVYRGVSMACVGILAYRSAINDSNTEIVPDFHKKADRAKYKNDHWTPDPARRGKEGPWPSIRGKIVPSKKALAYAKKIWRANGYTGE
jgi:predicted dehydrogenase